MDINDIDVAGTLRENKELKELYQKLLELPKETLAASVVDLWLRMKGIDGVLSLPHWEYVEDPQEGEESEDEAA